MDCGNGAFPAPDTRFSAFLIFVFEPHLLSVSPGAYKQNRRINNFLLKRENTLPSCFHSGYCLLTFVNEINYTTGNTASLTDSELKLKGPFLQIIIYNRSWSTDKMSSLTKAKLLQHQNKSIKMTA